MDKIFWKKFKLKELFLLKNGRDSTIAQKNLNKSSTKNSDYCVSIVTESAVNNAIGFYLKADDPVVAGKIILKGLTIGNQFGNANWHNYPHFIIGNVDYVFFRDKALFDLCNDYVGQFFAKVISKIFRKSGLFGFVNKIDQDSFYRESIMLPCVEVSCSDPFIWQEDGKRISLAIDYIKSLMEKAKEQREQRTIRLYENEKIKYENERNKIVTEYESEKARLIWKRFKLIDLFSLKNGRDSSIAQKNLNKSSSKDEDFTISIVTESAVNNAIGFYLKADDPVVAGKVVQRGLTIGTQFGNANWHSYPHFIIGNVDYISFKNDKLLSMCNDYVGEFFAKIISKIFRKSGFFGFVNKIDQDSFYRESIMLPCLEVSSSDNYFWEENGKHYSCAFNYLSYLYLTGMVHYNQNLINNYSYQY